MKAPHAHKDEEGAARAHRAHRAHFIIEVSWVLRHAAEHSPKTATRSNVVTCGAHAHQGSWAVTVFSTPFTLPALVVCFELPCRMCTVPPEFGRTRVIGLHSMNADRQSDAFPMAAWVRGHASTKALSKQTGAASVCLCCCSRNGGDGVTRFWQTFVVEVVGLAAAVLLHARRLRRARTARCGVLCYMRH